MKLYLVRHGQDQDNYNKILNGHRDTDLTGLGKEQARITGQKFIGKKLDVIYSSPLKRAYDTAWIIAHEVKKTEVITNEILIERDFGILTGKTVADIPVYSPHILKTEKINWFIDPEGAETFQDLLMRAEKTLHLLHTLYQDKTLLVVSHGDLCTMMYAAHYHLTWETVLQTIYLENTGVLELT